MKLSRRRVIWGLVVLIVLVLATRFVVPSVMFLGAVVIFTRKWTRQAERGRDHLFFETDYEELLAACRELSQQTAAGKRRDGQYQVYLGKRDPETLSFPQVILDLKPACVYLNWHGEGQVVIELFPGPEWYGVAAYPEGSEGHGGVKLIEGLWYFDSVGGENHPEYAAQIKDMVEKGRQWRASRAAAPAQTPQQQ